MPCPDAVFPIRYRKPLAMRSGSGVLLFRLLKYGFGQSFPVMRILVSPRFWRGSAFEVPVHVGILTLFALRVHLFFSFGYGAAGAPTLGHPRPGCVSFILAPMSIASPLECGYERRLAESADIPGGGVEAVCSRCLLPEVLAQLQPLPLVAGSCVIAVENVGSVK